MPRISKDAQKKDESKAEDKDALLVFLRQRVESFDQERAELLQRVENLGLHAAEQHKLEWENHQRADEVRELQKALSEAHMFLFDERQRLLSLQAENDELRLRDIEDRKRIQQLLAGGEGSKAKQTQPSAATQYSTDTLLMKIESLQAQLNEQKQLASERIAALLEDRRIREGEEASHRQQLNQEVDTARGRVVALEEQLRTTTRDYILAKRDKQSAEERAHECEAALAAERQRVGEELGQMKRRYDKELRDVQAAAEAKWEDVTHNLRKQLRTKEDEVISLTSVHTALKAQLERRVAELDDKVVRLTAANKQLETRRHQDMEGFAADITYLRKMLTAVDRKLHEMRLVDRLQDDERLDAILSTLRRKAPVPEPLAAASDTARQDDRSPEPDSYSVKGELAKGLSEIRGRIAGLDSKLNLRRRKS